MAHKKSRVGRRPTGAMVAQPGREIGQQPVGELPAGYPAFLEDLKARIRKAQVKAALSVNRELIQLYWSIGRDIVQRQRDEGWGKAVVERLAADLKDAFPGLEGFSARNIWHARAFYLAYASEGLKLKQAVSESSAPGLQRPVEDLHGANLPQLVSEIPWGHNARCHTLKPRCNLPAGRQVGAKVCGTPRTVTLTAPHGCAKILLMAVIRRTLKRYEEPGHARYLTESCCRRLPLFGNDRIKEAFAAHLARVRRRWDFQLYAWVIMPEHIHLLLAPRVPAVTVTDLLRALKRPFAAMILKRWRELDAPLLGRLRDARGAEHFWLGGGGYDRNIFSPHELREKAIYIHNNPVRRGLVSHAADWAWSSACWYERREGLAMDPLPV